MAMSKSAKQALAKKISDRFEKANAAIVAEYRSMTVAELTELRVALKKANAEFRVLKNRVGKKGVEAGSAKSVPLAGEFKGPIGVVYMYGDAAQATKVVLNFEKDHERFKVRGGLMDARLLGAGDLKAIADLPSREVLLATVASMLLQPAQQLVTVLGGMARNVSTVLSNYKDKKEKGE